MLNVYMIILENRLNMKQIQFVKLLVDYVVKNGIIEIKKLIQQPFNTVGQVYEILEIMMIYLKKLREY